MHSASGPYASSSATMFLREIMPTNSPGVLSSCVRATRGAAQHGRGAQVRAQRSSKGAGPVVAGPGRQPRVVPLASGGVVTRQRPGPCARFGPNPSHNSSAHRRRRGDGEGAQVLVHVQRGLQHRRRLGDVERAVAVVARHHVARLQAGQGTQQPAAAAHAALRAPTPRARNARHAAIAAATASLRLSSLLGRA